jgi:hypothetical protein
MILVHVSRSSTPELHQRARSRAKLRAHDKEHLQVSTVVDSNAPHILLVEDNPADMRLTLEALKEAKVVCNLHWVKDGICGALESTTVLTCKCSLSCARSFARLRALW